MANMSAEEAQAYLARRRLMEEVETVEVRRTLMETKLRQLAALMASRDIFDPEPDTGHESGGAPAEENIRGLLAAHPEADQLLAQARQ
jgi:hypothetical protein